MRESARTRICVYAEIGDLREQMKMLDDTGEMLRETFGRLVDDTERAIDSKEIIQFEKAFTRLISRRLNIGTAIDKKRKMMLDIDTENVMTISAAVSSSLPATVVGT